MRSHVVRSRKSMQWDVKGALIEQSMHNSIRIRSRNSGYHVLHLTLVAASQICTYQNDLQRKRQIDSPSPHSEQTPRNASLNHTHDPHRDDLGRPQIMRYPDSTASSRLFRPRCSISHVLASTWQILVVESVRVHTFATHRLRPIARYQMPT
jgi:hypothetical protein